MGLARAAVSIGLAATLLWGADVRRKLWDLDLSIFTNHRADRASQVWGIRFSPDETKVAIGFGPRSISGRRILVVALDQPRTALRDFELDTPGSPLAMSRNIAWSPSGTILVAAMDQKPLMLRLDGRTPCAFPKDSTFGGFLSGDRLALSV